MTDKQTILYWRRWGAVCHDNDWRMVQGRLLADAEANRARSEWHGAVWTAAENHARQQHRAITADDLRHGCHIAALGQDKSSKALSNADFNRLLTLFALLINEVDLSAVTDWMHPDRSEQRSYVAYLKKQAPEAVIIDIARNAQFLGSIDNAWEDLPLPKLRWLSSQLKDRRARYNRPVEKEVEPANVPF